MRSYRRTLATREEEGWLLQLAPLTISMPFVP
jgi:hypothetical protein